MQEVTIAVLKRKDLLRVSRLEGSQSDFSNDVNSCIRFLLIFVSKLIIFGLTRRYGHLTYFDYFDQYRCWIISIITRSENAAHSHKFISFITRRLLELTLKRFFFAPFFPLLNSLTYCIHIEQRLYTTKIPRYLTVGQFFCVRNAFLFQN